MRKDPNDSVARRPDLSTLRRAGGPDSCRPQRIRTVPGPAAGPDWVPPYSLRRRRRRRSHELREPRVSLFAGSTLKEKL